MRKLRTKRSYLVMPSLLAFIIILFIVTPIFSQDGWTKLQVGDEGVFIFRDEFGVPHVLADSAGALFEAFGYVAAQDRLTQLEISRRQARGRLAEGEEVDRRRLPMLRQGGRATRRRNSRGNTACLGPRLGYWSRHTQGA